MTLKDELLKAIEKSSWVPYTGPYGGEGWMNPQTGEVRYQDTKPGEENAEDPTTFDEAYEQQHSLDPEEDEWESDLTPWFDEGEPVTVDGEPFGMDGEVETQVVTADDGVVEVDDPSVEGQQPTTLYLSDLAGESLEEVVSAEPPDTGWESGWMDAPESIAALEEGQQVEIYDPEAGEYVLAEPYVVADPEADEMFDEPAMEAKVVSSDAWAPDEDADYELGDKVSVNPDTEAFVTAAEDPDYDWYDHIEELDEQQAANLSEGDEVALEMNDEVIEAEVMETPSPGSGIGESYWEVPLETEEGQVNYYTSDEHSTLYGHTETASPSSVLEWDGEENWNAIDGGYARFDHPAFGEVEGDVEVSEDPHGNTWLTIEQYPENLEEGATIELPDDTELDPPWRGAEVEVNWMQDGELEVEDVSNGASQVVDRDLFAEEVSVTSNPEHPLYAGNHVEEVENIWEETPESLEDYGSLEPGSEVLVEDPETGEKSIKTVVESQHFESFDDASVETADGETYTGEALGSIEYAGEPESTPRVPHEAETGEWQSVGSSFDHMETGDTLLYVNDTGELVTGEIQSMSEDGETATVDAGIGEEEVPLTRTARYADTGSPLPFPEYEPRDVDVGDGIKGEFIDADGEVRDLDGMVTGMDGDTLRVTDGETDYRLQSDEVSIQSRDSHIEHSEYLEMDGTEAEADEVADEIIGDGYTIEPEPDASTPDRALSKQVEKWWEHKSQMKDLRSDFKRFFNPNEVEEFYDGIDAWKHGGTDEIERKIESAFVEAFDLSDRVRETFPGDDRQPYSGESLGDLPEIAKVAAEISRRHYEENFGEWYRGGYEPSLRTAISDYLEDSERDSYDVDARALNNGTPNSRNDWNQWRIAPGDKIDRENVMLATDYMFNPEGSLANEDEIWATFEDVELEPSDLHIDHNSDFNLEGTPDEWDDLHTEVVAKEVAKQAPYIFDEVGSNDLTTVSGEDEIAREGTVSDSQAQNLYEMAKQARDIGVNHEGVDEMFHASKAILDKRGLLSDVDGGRSGVIDALEGYEPHDFEGVFADSAVPAQAPVNGEVREGYIIDQAGGQLEFEDEVGYVHEMPMDQIEWVDETELPEIETDYESPSEGSEQPDVPDTSDFTELSGDEAAEELEPGDWAVFNPDPEQYPQGVAGRVTEVDEVDGMSDVVSFEDSQSLGDEEFPLSTYSGGADEVQSIQTESSEGSDEIPELSETDLVQSNPEFEDLEQGDYVAMDGEVGVIDSAVEDPGSYITVDTPGGPVEVQAWEIDELVEPSDGGQSADVPFDEGDTVDMPMFGSPVEVVDVDPGSNEVTVEDSNGYKYTEDLDHPDVETGEVVEPAEGSEDSPIQASELHDMEPAEGETLELANDAGDSQMVDVIQTSVDPAAPIHVESHNTGAEYLVWPDGEMEPA